MIKNNKNGYFIGCIVNKNGILTPNLKFPFTLAKRRYITNNVKSPPETIVKPLS